MIRPNIENPTPLILQYWMVVEQTSASGNSGGNQEGEVQSGVSSNSIRLSLPKGATCKIHLEVFQNDTLLTAVDGSYTSVE